MMKAQNDLKYQCLQSIGRKFIFYTIWKKEKLMEWYFSSCYCHSSSFEIVFLHSFGVRMIWRFWITFYALFWREKANKAMMNTNRPSFMIVLSTWNLIKIFHEHFICFFFQVKSDLQLYFESFIFLFPEDDTYDENCWLKMVCIDHYWE